MHLFSCIIALALACDSLSTGASAVGICPVKETPTHPVFLHGNECYQFHMRETRGFSAAQSECRSQGGNEVIIRNNETQQFLYNTIKSQFNYNGVVWIGLNDVSQEGKFTWVDGSAMTFSYWASDQPSSFVGSIEDCVTMDIGDGGHWHDYRCEDFLFLRDPHPFICEFPLKYIGSTVTLPPTVTTTTSATNPTATIAADTTVAAANTTVPSGLATGSTDSGSSGPSTAK